MLLVWLMRFLSKATCKYCRVIASAENMIGESSMKPDDVFTALNGETVEMLNSDAEGRMVLGDAVFYATQFKPQLLDFATLTGAAIVALGDDKAAAFQSHAENELKNLLTVACHVDEKVFELPITETERHLIKQSDVADLVNHTNGQGKHCLQHLFRILVVTSHTFTLISQALQQLKVLHIKVQRVRQVTLYLQL